MDILNLKSILRIFLFIGFYLISVEEGNCIFKPEQIYVKKVTLENGLSNSVVTDIIQDKMGFFWIATYDGLNRYDGQNMKSYYHNPDDSFSLPSSKIFRIASDDLHHLYLKTNSGFTIYDCKTDRCIKPNSLNKYQLQHCVKTAVGQMWGYDAKNGLIHFDASNFNLIPISKSHEYLLQYPLLDMFFMKNDIYMISDHGEVLWYSLLEHRFHYARMGNSPSPITGCGKDKDGHILLGLEEGGLICFNLNQRTYQSYKLFNDPLQSIQVNHILYDSIRDVLFLTSYGRGLYVYDYASHTTKHFHSKETNLALSGNYPTVMSLAIHGTLVLGYDGTGIDLMDMHIRPFNSIVTEAGTDLQTLRNVKRMVEGNKNDLWIASKGSGLVRYERDKEKLSFFNTENKSGIQDNNLLELCRENNELWMGYDGQGLSVMDLQTMQVKKNFKVGIEKNQISDGTIWSIASDNDHHIWVGTKQNGLNRIDQRTSEVRQFTSIKFPEFYHNGIQCFQVLSKDQLLIGTEKGLYHFSLSREQLKKVFPLNENDPSSFSSVLCISSDKKGRYWLGTDGSGIIVLDASYRIIRNFNASNSLNNGVIYGLMPQNDSTFWFSSNNGISRIVWHEYSLQPNGLIDLGNYNELNGLQAREFSNHSYTKLKDGSMVFGGVRGFNLFQPDDIIKNNIQPNLYISEFKVFENDFKRDGNISYLNEVNLNPFENSISITFNTLGYVVPEKAKYRYRLIGYDAQWIQAGSRNYISYTNLPSGDYEFQAMVCNYDGIWNRQYTSLKIHIATPFYRTWWFIVFCSFTAVSVVYWMYRYRIRQIKEKENMRIRYTKELAEVEMKALRAQINPHFLFNTLNSINNYILKNDTDKASKYLIKFSQLVRNILNHSSNSYITLQEELQTIEIYLQIEGMRFNEQFSYNILNPDQIHTAHIMIPSLLLQPYVENAIWHGLLHKEGEKNISIVLENAGPSDMVTVNIIDNGVGREKAKEFEKQPKDRRSYGMKLGEDRIKLMNQNTEQTTEVKVIDLYDDQGKNCGTQICISIPTSLNTIKNKNQ